MDENLNENNLSDMEVMDFLINLQETLGSRHSNQDESLNRVIELLKVHQEKRIINENLTENTPESEKKVKI